MGSRVVRMSFYSHGPDGERAGLSVRARLFSRTLSLSSPSSTFADGRVRIQFSIVVCSPPALGATALVLAASSMAIGARVDPQPPESRARTSRAAASATCAIRQVLSRSAGT